MAKTREELEKLQASYTEELKDVIQSGKQSSAAYLEDLIKKREECEKELDELEK